MQRAFFVAVEQKTEEFREGHDFSTPEELERLIAEQGLDVEPKYEPAASPQVIALAHRMLREIMRYQQFGSFPNGRPWGDQPWWRIGLYEAFFEGLKTRE